MNNYCAIILKRMGQNGLVIVVNILTECGAFYYLTNQLDRKDLWKPCAHVCTVGPPGIENHDTDHHRDLDDPGIADLARI